MTDFVMPKAGITMDEGTVLQWLVKAGDSFKEGQPLAVVETDKSSIEVNANEDGVMLAILVEAGKTVPVGTPIAHVGKPGEKPGAPPAPAPAAATAAAMIGSRVRISPLGRKLAVTLGVTLDGLAGTGPGGRILRRDVEAAHAAARTPSALTPTLTPTAAPTATPTPASAGPGKRITLTRMRRIIAERMSMSTSTIPQFRVSRAVDVSKTVAIRETLLPLQVKLSFNDLLIQACALALRAHPNANASFIPGRTYADSAIQQHEQVNIGLAVALDDGLVVPVVAGADRLSLLEIARHRESLVDAARSGKLTPAQLEGGTFTISSLGAFGIDQFDAIINPPEAAILAVGQVVRKPVVTAEGAVEVRPMLTLTLTCDHRVLDGADAARFLSTLADRLQLADQYRLA